MIEVDKDEHRHCVIVVDGVGTRTVLSIPHADGVELLKQLTEFYGQIEYGHGTDETPKQEGLLARLFKRFIK